MNSERKKRQEEVERLLRGEGLTPEADLEFQEEVRKAAAAIVQESAVRVADGETAQRRQRSLNAAATGPWLLAVGVALSFFLPALGALLIFCGIAAIAWGIFHKRRTKPSVPSDQRP